MFDDQAQRLSQQCLVLRIIQPRRASGGVRQDDDVEAPAGALDAMTHAYGRLQLRDYRELCRGERAHSDHQLRSEEHELAVEMLAAARDLSLVRHPVSAALGVA